MIFFLKEINHLLEGDQDDQGDHLLYGRLITFGSPFNSFAPRSQ
jgi:hypothetical protein